MTHEELQSITIEKGAHSSVTISGEVPFSYLNKHRAAAVTYLSQDIQIDGFRKGNVPEKILIERIGEMAILGEMAERTIREVYPQIVSEHKLEVIGYPQVSITKLANENPLGFNIVVAVIPDIALSDYKAIAKKINEEKESPEVTDEELKKQIEDILRQKVAYERLQEKAKKKQDAEARQKDLAGAPELPTPETVEKNDDKAIDLENLPLPELTDDYVKTLGTPGQFESVADFKTKLKEHLSIEKEKDVASRHRAKITDKIIEEASFELPDVLVEAELNQMVAQMNEDLTRAQLTMDDYLTHVKKSKEDLMNEWRPAAEKRARLQLVLNEIGKREHIKPDTGKVDHEVSHILEQYKDADESRVRIYVESLMINEEVLLLLESQ